MSGTRSPSKTAPATRPFSARLALILWPFCAGAVAINLFLLGLIGTWVGLPALPPVWALAGAVPLSLPATWAATRWVQGLIAEAEA
jgi:hypothetical protein